MFALIVAENLDFYCIIVTIVGGDFAQITDCPKTTIASD